MNSKTLACRALIVLWIGSISAFSESRLGRFEDSLPKPTRSTRSATPSHSSSLATSLFETLFVDVLVEGLFYGMAYGGLNSVGLVYPFEWTDMVLPSRRFVGRIANRARIEMVAVNKRKKRNA